MAQERGALEKIAMSALDKVNEIQAPYLRGYIRLLRKAFPNDTPAQLISRLETQYIVAVTGAGVGSGAVAAFPGFGTITSLATAGAETAFFLDASAMLALAVAHIHGIDPAPEERKTLVLGVVLGEAGGSLIQSGVGRSAKNWPEMLVEKIPGVGEINDSLVKKFAVSFASKRAALAFGRVIPAGIGAIIGGVGNRAMGKSVISNTRHAFGEPPASWPIEEPVVPGKFADGAVVIDGEAEEAGEVRAE